MSNKETSSQEQQEHVEKPKNKRQKIAELSQRTASFVYNNAFINVIVYFILCNIMHHYASKLYIYFCAYSTPLFQINSVLMSPIVIISPHCMALRWLILETSNTVYFQILTCCSFIIARLSK